MASDVGSFEMPVADGERAHALYGGLFGWEFPPGNAPGYAMIRNTAPAGAIDATGGEGGGDGVGTPRLSFGVEEIGAGIDRVRALGGRAAEPVASAAGRFARRHNDPGTPFTLGEDANGG